ncbi:hypothetical protein LPJ56_000900 [Coemansia sp. RSA 2599]|nr:hypothetical protein LPJ75_000505 [Coemansia sp. RSA 2598]KAJ1828762.1 hypothetical protein LPJ56_000900 [Coemansia sp. RSA 2599]
MKLKSAAGASGRTQHPWLAKPQLLLLLALMLSLCTMPGGGAQQADAKAVNVHARPQTLVPRQIPGPAPQSNDGNGGDGDNGAQPTDGLDTAEEPQSSPTTRVSTTTVEASTTSVATTTVSEPPSSSPQEDPTTSAPQPESSTGPDNNSSSTNVDTASSEPTAADTDTLPTSDTREQQQTDTSTDDQPATTPTVSSDTEDPSTSSDTQQPSSEATDASTPSGQDRSSDGLSGGAIAGIVVGVVVFAALVVGGILLFLWHRRRKSRQASINGDFDSDFPNYQPPVAMSSAHHGYSASAGNGAANGAAANADSTGMAMPASYTRNYQPMAHMGDGYINDTYSYQSPQIYAGGIPQQPPAQQSATYHGYL